MSEANQSAAAEAPLRLLLVEDSKFDAKLIQTYLRSADAPRGLEISHASRLQDSVDHLKAHHCDCVLLDLGLPDGEGVDNIEAILGAAPDVAIVVLTGLKNDKVATSALQQGAQDYIVKGDYEDGNALLRTVRYAIERRAMQVQQSTAQRVASEELVRGIVATVPDALITLREGGVVESANPAAEAMFGYPLEQLVGMTVYDLNPPERRDNSHKFIDGLLDGSLEPSVVGEAEGVGLHADGSTFPTEFSIGRMESKGQPMLVFAVRDITDRKHAEQMISDAQEQLLVAEKLASLGGLVAGVAHEINTPIGIGVTAASHLREQTEQVGEAMAGGQLKRSMLEGYLKTAETSTQMLLANLQRAAELIQGFKQVAVDQSSDEFRSFYVDKYVADTLISLAPKLKASPYEVVTDIEPDLCIQSHPGSWSQVLTNLIMNSLLHAFEGRDSGTMTIRCHRDGDRLKLEYLDDGVGISEANLKKIYDPFFTTKRGQGGSGLGLNVVYNIVSQGLSGKVHCTSTLGEGVHFTFDLPYIEGTCV